MDQKGFAPSETMQLHELLTLKNLSLTKSVTMSPLVSDNELKSILQQDVTTGEQHIRELKGLLEQSSIAVSENTKS
ncbi:spore coat protein [Clostridium sp. CX1]|uniref:spore coat protein n=1 Tax=Clostridium sp. CX1 TaxID=2978346 RepID=UPI0021C03DFD|nr:spore coat protein [Clostridium sp. CX1]MCT8975045.1 spore coat protein [Clostridium sp. CX1]